MSTESVTTASIAVLTWNQCHLDPFPSQPTLITDGLSAWPAMTRWSPTWLRAMAREHRVGVMTSASGYFKFRPDCTALDLTDQQYVKDVPFQQVVDWITDETGDARKYYLQQTTLLADHPELLADLRFPPAVGADGPQLWFGSAGVVSPLHFDTRNNFFAQICGSKRFILFAPEQMPLLYPFPEGTKCERLSYVDAGNPDATAHPLYRNATPIELTVCPGQLLCVPAFWWHYVRSETVSISVNQWCTPDVVQYVAPNALRILRTAYKQDAVNFRSKIPLSTHALLEASVSMLTLNCSAAVLLTALALAERTGETTVVTEPSIGDRWTAVLATILDGDQAQDRDHVDREAKWCVQRIRATYGRG